MAPPAELQEFYKVEHAQRLPLYQRMWKGFMSNPVVWIGGAGWTGIVAYAAYNFKNRKGGSASMYVMHYRVVAQFAFIGTVGLGLMGAVTYSAFRKSMEENNKKKAIKSAEESVSHR